MPTKIDGICQCCGDRYTWIVPNVCPICEQRADAIADNSDPEIVLALAREDQG